MEGKQMLVSFVRSSAIVGLQTIQVVSQNWASVLRKP